MAGIVTLRARQPVLVDVRSANNIQMQLAAELGKSHSRSSVAYTYSCMFFPYEDVVFCSTIKQSSDFRCISVQNPTFRHLICSGGPYSQHRGGIPAVCGSTADDASSQERVEGALVPVPRPQEREGQTHTG